MAEKMKRWVVKVGSNILCEGGPLLVRSWMNQVKQLRTQYKIEVIWVTSGAIASAAERTGFERKKGDLAAKQALSAIGQPLVMDLYNLSLQVTGQLGAQVLLTYDDLAHQKRRRNFVNTMERLLDWGVTPILNENDAVATEEIQFGDNDSLSARVACALAADKLVILTDVEGLFDRDPRDDERAQKLDVVERITPSVTRLASGRSGSSRGRGGMLSKVKAAAVATRAGIETQLVRGDLPGALVALARHEPLGTRFLAQKGRSR